MSRGNMHPTHRWNSVGKEDPNHIRLQVDRLQFETFQPTESTIHFTCTNFQPLHLLMNELTLRLYLLWLTWCREQTVCFTAEHPTANCWGHISAGATHEAALLRYGSYNTWDNKATAARWPPADWPHKWMLSESPPCRHMWLITHDMPVLTSSIMSSALPWYKSSDAA